MENGTSYGCCACIGAAGTAIVPISAIMAQKDGFAINHYMQGEFVGNMPSGGKVRFCMTTGYPYDGKVKITWECDSEEAITLSLRIPSYASGVLVDGQVTATTPNTYLNKKIAGQGNITIEFPLTATATTLNGKVAVEKGCIVYAADERNQDVDVKVSGTLVSVKSVEKDFDCREAIEACFDNGACVKMVDYASAGAEWNTENCTVNVWLDC